VTTLPRASGGQDFESGDPHHHSNSLDKRTYVSSYIGKGKGSYVYIGLTPIIDGFLVVDDFRKKKTKYVEIIQFSVALEILIYFLFYFPFILLYFNFNPS
jgi:hypothetical protein